MAQSDRVPNPSQWLTPRSFAGSSSEDIDAFMLDYETAIEAMMVTLLFPLILLVRLRITAKQRIAWRLLY